MIPEVKKARARVEFGKFNFASDFDHCRYYLRRLSTTICNVLFVSGMFGLFTDVRPVRQARFYLVSVSLNAGPSIPRYRNHH